jgi:hypothetical protein
MNSNIISAVLGETATVRTIASSYKAATADDDDEEEADDKCWSRVKSWFFQKQAENKFRISIFIILYVASNVLIFFVVTITILLHCYTTII